MAPTQSQIRDMFKPLSIQGSQSKFFDHVDDKVDWTIPGHSPLSRTYTSKQEFIKETLTFLGEKVMTAPLVLEVIHISGGGGKRSVGHDRNGGRGCKMQKWYVLFVHELLAARSWAESFVNIGLSYDMHYCWVCEFDGNDKIVRVRAYLDTKLLTDAIKQNV